MNNALPRPVPGRLCRWALDVDRVRPELADGLAAVVLAAASLPWLLLRGRHQALGWPVEAALLLPLVWRRRHATPVFAVMAAVALAQWFLGVLVVGDVALLAAAGTVASERPRREALAAWVVLEVGAVLASARWRFAGSWVRSLIGLSGLAAAAVLVGVVVQARRQRLAELTDRAARLEFERDQQAQIAAAAERVRIAREMHDVIAHSLAVMVNLAEGASAKLGRDPERAAAAIDAVAEVGRQALGETRRLVGVLRERGGRADLTPQPGLDGLAELVDNVRRTGLDASVELRGDPTALPPGAQLTVYRIVQEATTNTLKHALRAGRVRVLLAFDRGRVGVEIADDGEAGARNAGASGHGIEGMRERVALFGGTVDAGPGPGGGWVVRASFDIAGTAEPAPAGRPG